MMVVVLEDVQALHAWHLKKYFILIELFQSSFEEEDQLTYRCTLMDQVEEELVVEVVPDAYSSGKHHIDKLDLLQVLSERWWSLLVRSEV